MHILIFQVASLGRMILIVSCCYGPAIIDMSGGSVNWLFSNDSGTVQLSGGTVRDRARRTSALCL